MVDKMCGTQNYEDMADNIIVNWKLQQVEAFKVKEEAKQSIRVKYLEEEIHSLNEQNKKNKQLILEYQEKLRKIDPETSLDDLK